MSDTLVSLQNKIASAGDLQAVVRTMKTMAASSISQYEQSVLALEEYFRTVQLGLLACIKNPSVNTALFNRATKSEGNIAVVVFGSDQGLVGQFNEAMTEFIVAQLAQMTDKKKILTVGDRLRARLTETDLNLTGEFALPNSIAAITALVGDVLLELETQFEQGEINEVYVFHQKPTEGNSYKPSMQRLLPLDNRWQNSIATLAWPSKNLPEVIGDNKKTLLALVHEYLFVSLFRACAESLASENASRLAAMQRAEKNINELLDSMKRNFHRLRQNGIDEELFDLVSGFEAIK
jgi:F-type H+-transporting ATPase subunit gamma